MKFERPIGQTLVGIAAGELAGPLAGRALAFSWSTLFKGAAKGSTSGGLNLFKWGAEQTEKLQDGKQAIICFIYQIKEHPN